MPTTGSIDYTNRDYLSFRQAMLDAVRPDSADSLMPEWTSQSDNDFGVVLIELFAYVADILSYYGDRVAAEAFLLTATQRSSLINIAALMDYRPEGQAAATVDLVFSSDSAEDVLIPTGTEITTDFSATNEAVIFQTIADLLIPGAATDATVAAAEGRLSTNVEIGISEGSALQSFGIPALSVVESSILVYVQETPDGPPAQWGFVDRLTQSTPNDHVHTRSVDDVGAITIYFGDGVNGRIPPRSARILASYRVGGGEGGNVAADTLVVPVGTLPGGATVRNPAASFGGANIEDIESIRSRLPQTVTVQDRAVTTGDYAALALRVPGVAKARATAMVYTNVTVYIAPPVGSQPDIGLIDAVAAYINAKKMINVSVLVGTPTYPTFDITATVQVAGAFAQYAVLSQVQDAVRTAFSYGAVDFGQRITVSEVYSAVNSVAGVDYGIVTLLARTGATGVADVLFNDGEIPQIGTLNIQVTGGLAQASVPIGVGGGVAGAPGAPVLDLTRCDPTSYHVEAHWAGGANTTEWTFQVIYYANANVVATAEYGPVSVPSIILDLPQVGISRGINSVAFRARAFNGVVGPVDGPTTAIAYTCG